MAAKRRTTPQAPEDTDDLLQAVRELRDEVRVLRESIDEFRTDFVHLLRNLPDNLPPPYQHLTTLATVVESPAGESRRTETPVAPHTEPPRPGHLF